MEPEHDAGERKSTIASDEWEQLTETEQRMCRNFEVR